MFLFFEYMYFYICKYIFKKNYVFVRFINCNVWLSRLWLILLKDIKLLVSIMFWVMVVLLNEGIEDYK